MWSNLSTMQKVIFTVLIALVVPFAPEFIFIADIGGMELVFGFLVLYYKPLILKVKVIIERVKAEIKLLNFAFLQSAITNPKVYVTQSAFYLCAFIVTGSMVYSSVFFLPAFLLNGVVA